MKKLRYHQYWVQCNACKRESRFPVYEHDGYMLMRNPQNKADARLLSWEDKTFDEVSDLSNKLESNIFDSLVVRESYKKIIINTINIEQEIFSFVCDPSNGVKYIFGGSAVCPYCHSHNIKGWGPTEDPYETIDADYPFITHHYWDGLSFPEKEKIAYDEVFRIITEKLVELEAKD